MNNFFNDEDDSSDSEEEFVDIKNSLARQNTQSKSLRRHKIHLENALKEDGNIFEFDRFLEEKKDDKSKTIESTPGESKYVSRMMNKAEERKRDYSILVEGKIKKEIEKEKEKLGNVQVFITPAYKEKLKERELWKKQRENDEIIDSPQDLTFFHNNVEKFSHGKFSEEAENSEKKTEEKKAVVEEEEEERENEDSGTEENQEPLILGKRKFEEIEDSSSSGQLGKEKISKTYDSEYLLEARKRYKLRQEEKKKKESELLM